MTISVGDRLPDVTVKSVTDQGTNDVTTGEFFAGKTVALFAVPGAFTPTCHQKHMPGFIENLDALKARGVDAVACTAVNDAFVMDAWGQQTGAKGKMALLADGNADFARAIGMDIDLGVAGLGVRSKRYAMLVEDGVVKALNVEDNPSNAETSSAAELLKTL